MNEELLNNYRLIHVTVACDEALVSLTTGDVLAGPSENYVLVSSDVPRVTLSHHDAKVLLGEEYNWNDVVAHLQANYDWENKNLP